jgi:O-antigen/teichoic acid export membrane protein
MPGVARNTATLLVASILQKVIAFVYFALIARWAGVADTGTYFFAASWTLMFSIVTDCGLTSVLIRDSARDHAQAKRTLDQVLTLKIPLVAAAALLTVLIAYAVGTSGEALRMVALGAGVLALDAISLTFYGVLRGHHVLKYEGIGLIIGQTFTLAVGVWALRNSAPLSWLMLALMAGSAWNAVASYWVVRKRLGIVPSFAWDKAHALSLVKAAVPFALAGAFVKVYTNADAVLLTRMAGKEAAGLYSVPYKLTFAFQFIPMALSAALFPAMSRVYAEDRARLGELLHKGLWALALVVAPIVAGIAALGPEIVEFVYGFDYLASVGALRLLIFTLVFIFLDFPIGSLLNATDRQATQTRLMGMATLISVALNVLLIPRWGVFGVAAASLVSHAALFLGGAWAAREVVQWPAMQVAGQLVRIALAAGGMAAAVLAAKAYLPLFAVIAFGGLAYAALAFLLGAVRTSDVRELAHRVLHRRAAP